MLLIASVLLIAAIGLLIIDLFIPTGGIFLILSACAGIASILVAFRLGFQTGLTFTLLVLGSVPILLGLFLKVWPHTAIGKTILGKLPEAQNYQWSTASSVQDIQSLIGCVGKTVTEMVPSGLVDIDGRKFESLSEGKPIEAGQTVRVLRLDVGRLVVTPCEAHETTREKALATTPISNSKPSEPQKQPSLLDQPIEDFGLESLDEEEKH